MFLQADALFARAFRRAGGGGDPVRAVADRVLAPAWIRIISTPRSTILRIVSLSTLAAGMAAIHVRHALHGPPLCPHRLFTRRRSMCSRSWARSACGSSRGIWFAIGYTVGAWVQFGVVYFAARSGLRTDNLPRCELHWREISAKPALSWCTRPALASNIIFTRAYATHAGPGMAAALDYCMRGVRRAAGHSW